MILTLKALLIIATSVVAWGLVLSLVFDRRTEPYLFTVAGKRSSILLARVAIWAAVIGIGVAAWFALSWVLPGLVALAIFFGFEAGALDICGQRIRFIQLPVAAPVTGAVLSDPWRR